MNKYNSIVSIKRANKQWANNTDRAYFFAKETMDFFSSKVYSKVYGGRFFITSEQYKATTYGKMFLGYKDGEILYTIRECKVNGEIETVGKFQEYSSIKDAENMINSLVHYEME